MTDLATATTAELIAELRRRRDQASAALNIYGTLADVIEQAVSSAWQIAPADLHSDTRTDRIARPRQVVMTLLREHGQTWSAAAARYKLDHGTAIWAAKKIANLESTSPQFAAKMQRLRTHIANALQSNKNSQTSVQTPVSAP